MSSSASATESAIETRPGAKDLAVIGRGLSKTYRIYRHPSDRLREMLRLGRGPFHREFHALRGVDLELRRGETFGIVGRNGSGKTTLLKLVCGLLAPSAGELEVRGQIAPILSLGAGFDLAFSGRENAVLNAAILGLPDSVIRDRLEAVEAFADIGDFFDQPVKTYSAGMAARLAFAVAVQIDPDILVVDELLAVGDEAFTRKCAARIDEIKSQGSTILFVSHAAHLVLELCDRALLLEHGEALMTGTPKRVLQAYARLLHSPAADALRIASEIREKGAYDDEDVAPGSASGVSSEVSAYGIYIPNLVPESTLAYESHGARIEGARVLGPDGLPVNLLRRGHRYTYAYEVRFQKTAHAVRFGMMIKLVSGFELAGQVSHPEGRGIPRIEAGTLARVRFQFEPHLARGSYFLNAGVMGLRDGVEGFLHRIVDAAMFQVEARPGEHATGYVDLAAGSRADVELIPG
jgi:lipopolysaccharide transport system ATP-binding protein